MYYLSFKKEKSIVVYETEQNNFYEKNNSENYQYSLEMDVLDAIFRQSKIWQKNIYQSQI